MRATIDAHVSRIAERCSMQTHSAILQLRWSQHMYVSTHAYAYHSLLCASAPMRVCLFTLTRYTLRYAPEINGCKPYIFCLVLRADARRFDLPAAICLHQFADGAHTDTRAAAATARNVADLRPVQHTNIIYLYAKHHRLRCVRWTCPVHPTYITWTRR